uniref:Uncharacterized protein LOC117313645 isoform X1 n=1 Tax=Tursiops truncatus TaxID=9739 RepID=A0A6J3RXZ2_TURTR|nr:uncharacterized protein LOC117313645 isoform X1 [Tursiops truncatus]
MCSRTGVLPWREKSTSHSCKQQYGKVSVKDISWHLRVWISLQVCWGPQRPCASAAWAQSVQEGFGKDPRTAQLPCKVAAPRASPPAVSVPAAPHPRQHLVLSVLWILAILREADPETRILMRELWLRTNAGSALGMWGAGPGRERPEEAVRSCTLRVRRAAEEAVVAGGLCPGATHPAALSPPPRPWQDRSESPLLQDAPGTCCVEDTGRN